MKLGISTFALFLLSVIAVPVSAVTTLPTQPVPQNAGVIITGYGTSAAQSSLDLVQLYNDTDNVISLQGWRLAVVMNLQPIPMVVVELNGYVKAESHLLLARPNVISGTNINVLPTSVFTPGEKLTKLVLLAPSTDFLSPEQPVIASDGVYRRGTTSTGYSTSTTFSKLTEPISLYADEYYMPPGVPTLQVVEVLPHHADCAPNDISFVCGDYIKLQNVGEQTVDLALYRLRTDSGSSASGNAFSLTGQLASGQYNTVWLRDDGERLSLTDSGGYVWFEDSEGLVQFYDTTMVSYPSASSTSKVGWSWAIDKTDGVWKWTSTPSPSAPNLITVPAEIVVTTTEAAECPAGKYRNPETNRCRTIEEAVNVLAQCEEGKERNPATNRCRSVVSLTGATLTPCDQGQERNPATNRCRSVAGTSTNLVPCDVGYERNPATNRCRKSSLDMGGIAAVKPDAASTNSTLQTALILTAGVSAVSYGIYEWRTELMRIIQKVLQVVVSK